MSFEGMDKFRKICSLHPGHQLNMADGRWHTTLKCAFPLVKYDVGVSFLTRY